MQIIDGKKISSEVKEEVEKNVKKLLEEGKKVKLVVILVGNDYASEKYVASKEKACLKAGIESETVRLSANISEETLLKEIDKFNEDKSVDGILVQLPLPKHIDTYKVVNRIKTEKDVDGFNDENVGKLVVGTDGTIPCTAKGIMLLLDKYNIETKGKVCTVVGRSNIAGKPLSMLMLQRDASVIMTHSKTNDLKKLLLQSDIIIVAIGKPNFIKASMIKEGAVLIDVGINHDKEGNMCGDVDFEDCKEKASYMTPVPGGVGAMTIAMLLDNCVELARKRKKK